MALVVRLHKIRGQIEAIERLVIRDAACTDVLNQVISSRNGLKSLADKIIHAHVRDCIENVRYPAQGRRNLRALITVLNHYVA